ncbi:uncharacterized protein EV422DRAFT_503911 [Fimicolochytrium jonesii]|uniref:uncharacterized protein n=1 Tax=Fimicolochytrium jonesii TaxID=1396493 RepID=UPI0022FE312E|nr:uncharacterized protein EV422DRAFT_503911 [Fimicolochytrium jonesii]KAI8825159.1 hypothetical protein EV422DRAFT_503911 [Fimicolochytrium jonesii]
MVMMRLGNVRWCFAGCQWIAIDVVRNAREERVRNVGVLLCFASRRAGANMRGAMVLLEAGLVCLYVRNTVHTVVMLLHREALASEWDGGVCVRRELTQQCIRENGDYADERSLGTAVTKPLSQVSVRGEGIGLSVESEAGAACVFQGGLRFLCARRGRCGERIVGGMFAKVPLMRWLPEERGRQGEFWSCGMGRREERGAVDMDTSIVVEGGGGTTFSTYRGGDRTCGAGGAEARGCPSPLAWLYLTPAAKNYFDIPSDQTRNTPSWTWEHDKGHGRSWHNHDSLRRVHPSNPGWLGAGGDSEESSSQ